MNISKTFNVRKTALIYEFSFVEDVFVSELFKEDPGIKNMFNKYRRKFCNRTVLMFQMFKGNYEIIQYPAHTNGDRIISNGNVLISELEDELRSLPFDKLEDLLKSMTQIDKYKL